MNVDDLRSSLAGDVLTPASAQYDSARRCFNALVDRRPALIVRCLGSDDVAAAFDFARAHELEVAVRGGGHNPAGHCVVDDGLVIDLSAMRQVDVEPARQIAHARGRRDLARLRLGNAGVRARHPGRSRRHDRRNRPHARGWNRTPDRAARPHLRQHRRRRARSSQRIRRARERGRERGAAVGSPRRRWQLRRGNPTRLSTSSARARRGRHARVSRRRCRRRPPSLPGHCFRLATRSQLPNGDLGRRNLDAGACRRPLLYGLGRRS